MQDEGQQGLVVWLTGLSGSGKSTLACAVAHELRSAGHPSCVLDGDVVRRGVCSDLGFSPQDRAENNRRVAEIARLMAEAGLFVIVALISPTDESRQAARKVIERSGRRFILAYLSAPLFICERRDPKGLYRRARNGEIPEFTGISAQYDVPSIPDLLIETAYESVETSVGRIVTVIETIFQDQSRELARVPSNCS